MTYLLIITAIIALIWLFVAYTSKKDSTTQRAYLYFKISAVIWLAELAMFIAMNR